MSVKFTFFRSRINCRKIFRREGKAYTNTNRYAYLCIAERFDERISRAAKDCYTLHKYILPFRTSRIDVGAAPIAPECTKNKLGRWKARLERRDAPRRRVTRREFQTLRGIYTQKSIYIQKLYTPVRFYVRRYPPIKKQINYLITNYQRIQLIYIHLYI